MGRPGQSVGRTVQAGLLAWVLPGAGHYWLGHRGLAVVFFVAISVPYWTGLAIGGVKTSVNPYVSKWLFLAEMGTGGFTSACYVLNHYVGQIAPADVARLLSAERRPAPELEQALARTVAYYPESDVAQIYLAAAGLLNVLAILDALARAQTGGLPVFHRERAGPARRAAGDAA